MEQYVNLVFTFHNVSINSEHVGTHTMRKTLFTFHNVSINSEKTMIYVDTKNNLHSIMYLLIPSISKGITEYSTFTFHNVSINSSH